MNQLQSVEEVISALKRRSLLILAVTVIGCVLSLHFALGQTKVYEATAVVQIEDGQVPDQLMGATVETASARKVRLIEQRLMARDNLVKIMEKHGLFTDDPGLTMNQRVFMMRQAAGIKEILNRESFASSDRQPSGLMITVRLSDPVKAADVANDLLYSVIEQSRDRNAERARDTLDFFASEEARIGAEIAEMDSVIADFKRANADQLPAGLTDLRSQLVSLRDTDLALDQQLLTLEASSARQREDVAQRQVALIQEQKSLIASRISEIEAQIDGAPEVERALNGLERAQEQLQDEFSVVTRRRAEAEMGQMLEDRQQTDRFEVLETALVPETPVSRSRKKLAVMGGVASFLLGLAVGFVAELMNPAFRNAAQMERSLGFQPVVSIPVIKTPKDRTRRGLALLGWALGLMAATGAALAVAVGRLPFGEVLAKILPGFAAKT